MEQTKHMVEPGTKGGTALQPWGWAFAACAFGAVVFGGFLVVAPAAVQSLFGWMMFGEPTLMQQWPVQAQAYTQLAHAVMGSVMIGWGLLMLAVIALYGPQASRRLVAALALPIVAWFVADCTASWAHGFLPNVALNAAFAVPMLACLAAWWASLKQ